MKKYNEFIKESNSESNIITIAGVKLKWIQDGLNFELGKPDNTGLGKVYTRMSEDEKQRISEALSNAGFKHRFGSKYSSSSGDFYLTLEFDDHAGLIMGYVEVASGGLNI